MNNQFKNQIQELISSHNLDDKDLLFNLKKLIRNKEFEGYTYDESLSFQELFESNKKIIFNEVENFNLIKTNFPTIDEEIGGFNKGELIVIGGRPSMGKTQFLISFLLNVAKTNPILYFTFDISKELLVNRILSSYTEISINKVLQLNLSQDEKERISSASEELNQLKLYINDSCQNVFHGFREQCKKHVEEHGVQLIFVDYLQMMVTNRHRFNREQEISTIVRELKNIAKELNVVIITTSQLSRSVEQRGGDKRPQLSDLRESGAIEQDADKVFFIYRPEYYGFLMDEEGNSTIRVVEMILSKNRNGRLNSFRLFANNNYTRYDEIFSYKENFEFNSARLNELENGNETNPF